jgi:hypothetical protein
MAELAENEPVPTFKQGQKRCIQLKSNIRLKVCFRLILKDFWEDYIP